MFLANFQIHLRTSSATLNSLESVVVPLAENGLTIWSRRLKSPLELCSD
jgi:hypothetical protein